MPELNPKEVNPKQNQENKTSGTAVGGQSAQGSQPQGKSESGAQAGSASGGTSDLAQRRTRPSTLMRLWADEMDRVFDIFGFGGAILGSRRYSRGYPQPVPVCAESDIHVGTAG